MGELCRIVRHLGSGNQIDGSRLRGERPKFFAMEVYTVGAVEYISFGV
jgi:hypothetical protein